MFSTNSGAAFPTVTAPGMLHVNTTGGGQVLWMRNAADNAWVQVSFGAGDFLSLGALSLGVPVTKTANFSVALGENHLINNKAGSACVVTLPSAVTFAGRMLAFLNRQAQTVVSASANVVPQGGGAAGTAILPAVIGSQAVLVSDGANWLVLESGALLTAFGQALGTAADAAAALVLLGVTAPGAAPLFAPRAWVNFNGTVGSGTYAQTGTTITVTITAHGLVTGDSVPLTFTTGTAASGTYTVTVTGANTFTVTSGTSATTSGSVTRGVYIRAAGNVSSVVRNAVGDYNVNFGTAMPDAGYATLATRDWASTVANQPIACVYDQTAATVRILTFLSNASNFSDPTSVYVAIFR
nr:hypothetical protein [Gemmobacter straminiformis]